MANDVLVSVLGEVKVSEMSWIHPHEHLLINMEQWRGETIANTFKVKRRSDDTPFEKIEPLLEVKVG